VMALMGNDQGCLYSFLLCVNCVTWCAGPVQGRGKLANKVAIITGGDSGIGRAVAVHFAREGVQSWCAKFIQLGRLANDALLATLHTDQ
jgi:hypothetical protein